MSSENTEIRLQIYNDLREQIFKGSLKNGMRLIETRLAQKYHVNKAHVRSVLLELQKQGLVQHIPMKGFVVIGVSKADLLEVAKIREMLESAIFDDFLKRASDEDLSEVMLYTKRKIAFLQAELKQEAHKETLATFDKIYSCTSYQRMAHMLIEYREYINIMIQLAFDMPDDVEKTIQNSTLLYHVFEKRDYELCKKWVEIRYENLVFKINHSSVFQ